MLIIICHALKKCTYFDVLSNILKHIKYLITILTVVLFDFTFILFP